MQTMISKKDDSFKSYNAKMVFFYEVQFRIITLFLESKKEKQGEKDGMINGILDHRTQRNKHSSL